MSVALRELQLSPLLYRSNSAAAALINSPVLMSFLASVGREREPRAKSHTHTRSFPIEKKSHIQRATRHTFSQSSVNRIESHLLILIGRPIEKTTTTTHKLGRLFRPRVAFLSDHVRSLADFPISDLARSSIQPISTQDPYGRECRVRRLERTHTPKQVSQTVSPYTWRRHGK